MKNRDAFILKAFQTVLRCEAKLYEWKTHPPDGNAIDKFHLIIYLLVKISLLLCLPQIYLNLKRNSVFQSENGCFVSQHSVQIFIRLIDIDFIKLSKLICLSVSLCLR